MENSVNLFEILPVFNFGDSVMMLHITQFFQDKTESENRNLERAGFVVKYIILFLILEVMG